MEIDDYGFKLAVRYAKEKNIYPMFKRVFSETYLKNKPHTETNFIARLKAFLAYCGYNNLYRHLRFPGEEDEYLTEYRRFFYKQHKALYIKEFKNFLKKHEIYASFLKNINGIYIKRMVKRRNLKYITHNNRQKKLFENLTPESFIINAFDWEATKEGSQFWSGLHYTWLQQLNSINKTITANDGK